MRKLLKLVFWGTAMRLIPFILLLLTLSTEGVSQMGQPHYIGNASWIKAPGQQPPDTLPVSITKYPVIREVSANNVRTITQRKTNAGTKVVHIGKTVPILQKIRFSGKKISAPEMVDAPPLLTRDNAAFNISYTDKQHGFAGSNTTDFAEDAEHQIWIASSAGLIRYDGYHYFLYSQKNGMPDLPDLSIVYDNQKRLWLASENGVYYIQHDSLFSLQCNEIDFSKIACRKVQIDSSSNAQKIWISTKKNGAICVDGSSVQIFDKRCGLPVEHIVATYLDKKGNLFLASFDGIIVITPDKILQLFAANKEIPTPVFLSFYEDEEGIWAGSFSSGLIRMGATDTIQYSVYGQFNERIYDIKKAPGGLWLSIYGRSLCYYSKKNLLVIDESNGLLNRFPFMLFEDSFQNIWVSSLQSGFSRINENCLYVQPYENTALGSVKAVLPDRRQGAWFISEGKNLVYKKGNTATSFFSINRRDLFTNSLDGILNEDGSLWMGSYGEGVVHATENEFTVYRYSDFVDYGVIKSIKKDADKKVWFSPVSFGLVQYDNHRFWHYTQKSGLLSNLVNQLFLDWDKKIHWTFANGFQRLGKSGIETFYIGNTPFKDQVNGMLPVDGHTTIIATNDNGLLFIHDTRTYQLTTANGLSSNRVKTIIRDGSGKIWISTDKAIESFFVKDVSLTDHTVFNQSNGSYIVNSTEVYLDSEGLPYWSMYDKKLVFNPVFLHQQNTPPVFSIRQVLVDDKIQDPHSGLSMLPNQKIDINYTAIFWGREHSLEIKYMLISNSGDTSIYASGNKGHITIGDALPGKYRIVLMAKDGNHTYYSSPLSIHINEFWYNTWLFRIFGGCLLIAGIISYFRWKANLQEAINKQLETRVSEQTSEILKEKEELQKSYEIIGRQSQEKDVLIQEINHRVKNNLQLIAAMVEMQLSNDYSKETLLALLGTSRRLKAMSLVHELLYYQRDVQGLSTLQYIHELIDNLKEMTSNEDHPIHFRIDVEDIYLDSRSALSIGMIISELVSNSFKYAFNNIASPEITISLVKDNLTGYFYLRVADNGNGVTGNYETQKNLGSRLIDIFSRQLEGTYTLDYNNHFVFILHFKPAE